MSHPGHINAKLRIEGFILGGNVCMCKFSIFYERLPMGNLAKVKAYIVYQ
jgi:hypothetical protein